MGFLVRFASRLTFLNHAVFSERRQDSAKTRTACDNKLQRAPCCAQFERKRKAIDFSKSCYLFSEGAAMTAKEDGLWTPRADVTHEEVRHMQARVEVFRATHVVGEGPSDFHQSPKCAASWCRWIVSASTSFAARQIPRNVELPLRRCRTRKSLPALPTTEEDERGDQL